MAKNNQVDLLNDSVLTFKAKTITEAAAFYVPVFGFGVLPGALIAAIMGMTDAAARSISFGGEAYLWALIPLSNVLAIWPLCLKEDAEDKLKTRGYSRQKVTYGTALKSWFRIPGFAKKKVMNKGYVKVHAHNVDKLYGAISSASAAPGDSTHEVTDYLISDAKGIRVERHIEPTPVMLWDDALNTIDEGFGLQKI